MGTNPPPLTPDDDDPKDHERRSPPHVTRVVRMERRTATFVYDAGPPAFSFSHDTEKGLFILTWADGRIEKFRDKPCAGSFGSSPIPRPASCGRVIRNGLPVFLYLCREEREQG